LCGKPGQPCCGGTVYVEGTCNDGAVCQTSTSGTSSCVACGGQGEPCCAGSTCSSTSLICRAGSYGAASTCAACGASGQPCCSNSTCDRNSTCWGGTCY
jgi:hypothetical protein